MNQRLLSVLAFAFVVAGGASFLLYRLVSAQVSANQKVPANRVLVASHNLENGAAIKDEDVKFADWGGPIPPNVVLKAEDAVGRGVIQPIYEGEIILESRLAAKGAGAGLAATIPPGMRAVAVRVNDIVGVAGFVIPGMHVDVLIAGTPPGVSTQATGSLTKTLLQNVEVLSAGQNIQKDSEGKPINVNVVNMLVTPEQAEVLSLASNETRIQLVLRNPLDKDVAKTPGTVMANLFHNTGPDGLPLAGVKPPVAPAPVVVRRPAPVAAAPPPPPPPPPAPKPEPKVVPPITVEIIHGSSRSEAKFKPEEGQQQQ